MKKLTAVICTAMMALSLTACGGNTKEVSVDPDKLAQELLTAVTSDDLSKSTMDLSTVYFYDANNVSSAVAYASSGATSCEVAVVESKDASETADVKRISRPEWRTRKTCTLPTTQKKQDVSMMRSSRVQENIRFSVSVMILIRQTRS